jgi:hypothetical protein
MVRKSSHSIQRNNGFIAKAQHVCVKRRMLAQCLEGPVAFPQSLALCSNGGATTIRSLPLHGCPPEDGNIEVHLVGCGSFIPGNAFPIDAFTNNDIVQSMLVSLFSECERDNQDLGATVLLPSALVGLPMLADPSSFSPSKLMGVILEATLSFRDAAFSRTSPTLISQLESHFAACGLCAGPSASRWEVIHNLFVTDFHLNVDMVPGDRHRALKVLCLSASPLSAEFLSSGLITQGHIAPVDFVPGYDAGDVPVAASASRTMLYDVARACLFRAGPPSDLRLIAKTAWSSGVSYPAAPLSSEVSYPAAHEHGVDVHLRKR